MIGKVCVRGKDAPVEFCRAPACVAGSVHVRSLDETLPLLGVSTPINPREF